uniref:RING-CH-type domain-containing protein n=1 Tax=Panagrolaimus sp. PS1159 TaxID=55785 RepID=A0AC35FV66_9BILA
MNNEKLAAEEKECRFCFCSELESAEGYDQWITPCKCDGSIKWVHQKCFEQWIDFAPIGSVNQRNMCGSCGFTYQRTLEIKPIFEWKFPPFGVLLQFSVDIISTYSLTRDIWGAIRGKRYVFAQNRPFNFWIRHVFPRIKNGRIIKDILETTIFEPKIISLNEK